MSDDTYLEIHLFGPIETVETLEKIIFSLNDHNLYPEGMSHEDNFKMRDAEYIKKGFRNAVAHNCNPYFTNPECYYGNIDGLEELLQELKIPYHFTYFEGSEYPGMIKAWKPDTGLHEEMRMFCEPALSIGDLRKILSQDNHIWDLHDWIREAELAQGTEMGSFSVSDEVREWLIAA